MVIQFVLQEWLQGRHCAQAQEEGCCYINSCSFKIDTTIRKTVKKCKTLYKPQKKKKRQNKFAKRNSIEYVLCYNIVKWLSQVLGKVELSAEGEIFCSYVIGE